MGYKTRHAIPLALAAIGALAAGAPTFAEPLEQVVVGAVHTTTTLEFPHMQRHAVASLTRQVSYADLDLVSYAGVQELEARIDNTANAICEKLDGLYGRSPDEKEACVRDAVKDAMKQAKVAITAAAGRGQ